MAKKEKETEALSKSKAKREERQKQIAKEKKKKRIEQIIGIVVLVAIIGVLAYAIGFQIYKAAIRTTSNQDFSAGLTSEGMIEGVDAASMITLADYENLIVPMEEVAATEEEVDADIQSTLSANQELSSDSTLVIAEGDVVNIDYVGTVDGEEFEGGTSEGGYDLTIGSDSFIEGFEDQLIGHNPGEEVVVEVTFPDEYTNSPDLAGKDASFAVTIHGVYVTPELTDEFVAEHLSDLAATAEEYRAYVENNYYTEHLTEYLTNYMTDNTTVNQYPKSYLKNVKGVLKYNDESMLTYYNQMFAQYGVDTYENVWDTRDGITNEIDYEHELTQRAQESVKSALIYQAVFEKAGLTLDMETYRAELVEENGEDYVTNLETTYGASYMAQARIQELVTDYLVENANVE